jgi:hypothetical protein
MSRAILSLLLALAACSSAPCGSGDQCVQGAGGDVCRARCAPDAGSPCPAGESCEYQSVCCSGSVCTAAVAQVCCPASGC